MKRFYTQFIDRLAAYFIIAILLGGDLLASIRVLNDPPIIDREQTTGFINLVPRPKSLQTGQMTHSSIEGKENVLGSIEKNERSFSFVEEDALAIIGRLDNGSHGRTSDDLVRFNLSEFDAQKGVSLSFDVETYAQGPQLTARINGLWVKGMNIDHMGSKTISIVLPAEIVRSGENDILFASNLRDSYIALSDFSIQSIEAKDEFTAIPDVLANQKFFRLTSSDSLNCTMLENTISQTPFIPSGFINITRGAYSYRMRNSEKAISNIEIAYDPAKFASPSNLINLRLYYFDKTSLSWKSIAPEKTNEAAKPSKPMRHPIRIISLG